MVGSTPSLRLLGFKFKAFGAGVDGLGFRVWGFVFGVCGLGRVETFWPSQGFCKGWGLGGSVTGQISCKKVTKRQKGRCVRKHRTRGLQSFASRSFVPRGAWTLAGPGSASMAVASSCWILALRDQNTGSGSRRV